ncbi:uncharacterized protein LOC129788623 [Lutzomyia longipalpis]|uniref:uncharacterized protein LOC129788623 n=1 Tax=Lutzomyia longipalpis TaxID=7200 RepID=UPI0024834E94|nr:uncharacterized protein LOC129788623 [Lutzomyia longipalpis]
MVSFRSSLRVLFYFSRVCGLAPLAINFKNSLEEISQSRFGVIYSILMGITYGAFHVTSSLFNLDEKADSNIITNIINYYNRYSRLLLFWICIVNAIVNQKKIIRALQLIENVDRLFANDLGYRVSHIKFSRLVLVEIFVYLASTFALEWNNCLMYITGIGVYNNYCMSMCLIPLIVANADQILFINLIYLIKERLALGSKFFQERIRLTKQRKKDQDKLNGQLLKTINIFYYFEHEMETAAAKVKMVQGKYSRGNIQTLSLGYSRLHEATQLINTAYGIPNVCSIFIRFVTLTTLAYSSCMRLLKLDNFDDDLDHNEHRAMSKVPGIVGWILLNIAEIVIFCYVCHRLREEGRYIGQHLQYYRVENSHQGDVEAAIDAFTRQLMHQHVEIAPCGFFTVDLTFVLALVATVTTYIMILIQFDISQKAQN